MRRLLPFLLVPSLVGCPGSSYRIELEVTVPPEVQAVLSSARPGMLMSKRIPLALLCDPTGAPFTVRFSYTITNWPCSSDPARGYQNMYVLRLSQLDLDWFAANEPAALCGETSKITDQSIRGAIFQRASMGMWETYHPNEIAAGSGGSCDAAGNYTGDVLLQLVQ